MKRLNYDYILVGGGLQSGLIAMAIRHHRPAASILLIERESYLAGNHTWSFHESDASSARLPWVEPLIEHRWPFYRVRVGGFEREVRIAYLTTSSAHFASVVESRLGENSACNVLKGEGVASVDVNHVITDGGQRYDASVVIDSRGPTEAMRKSFVGGYQKFWGFELELQSDWPNHVPILMDDCVDQSDGFRFFYTLPFSARRVLVEDTRFSNTSTLERDECWQQVENYLGHLGIGSTRIVREEHGVLPMPIGHQQFAATRLTQFDVLRGGYAGGWFHAATGYSFALAAEFANLVATTSATHLRGQLSGLARKHQWRNRYGRFLNRLMFELVSPATRYQIFRRFYRVLNESRVSRFYGHRFRLDDAIRIVVGIPPRGLRPWQFARSFRRWRAENSFQAEKASCDDRFNSTPKITRATT